MSSDPDHPVIFIVSTAVSGDLQGAHLAKELRKLCPGVRLLGAGGRHMAAAGVDVVVETVHLASVGFLAACRIYSQWKHALEEKKRIVREEKPDLVILLDSEGYFNECFSRFLSQQDVPFIHYFPPLVWLWGPWRARRIARNAHAIISTFPSEIPIYEKAGGRVYYFGNPLVDIVGERGARALSNEKDKVIGLMPGSRALEVALLARPMIEAAKMMQAHRPDLRFVLPVAGDHVRPRLEREIDRAGMQGKITLINKPTYEDLVRCDLVVVAAGTATLELTLLNVPMLVIYRLGFFTYQIVRFLVSTPFISMPNILAGRKIVVELRQDEVCAGRIATEMLKILDNPDEEARIRQGLLDVRQKLGEPGVVRRVAELILREAGILQKIHRLIVLHREGLAPLPSRDKSVKGKLWYSVDFLFWAYLERLTTRYYAGKLPRRRLGLVGRLKCVKSRVEILSQMKLVLGASHSNEYYETLWQEYAEESGLGLAEPIMLARSSQRLRHMIDIEGEELLQAALAGGKGVTFLLCHLGPMGCIPAAFGSRGYDISMTGTAMHRPYFEKKLREMLAKGPAGRALIGDNLPKRAAAIFRRNGIFSAYVDYSVGRRHGAWLALGQAEMFASLAGATIALMHDTPVFYVRCERIHPQHFRVQLIPLRPVGRDIPLKAGSLDLARQVFDYLEPDLLSRPAQWWPWDFAQLRPKMTPSIQPTGSHS